MPQHQTACQRCHYAEVGMGIRVMVFCPLHAAAPDLLAALEDLLMFFESGNSAPVFRATIRADSPWVAKARAAIAKAQAPGPG